jgi:hypothetical protein
MPRWCPGPSRRDSGHGSLTAQPQGGACAGVLLGAGLADGLAARRAGRVEAAGYSAERDPRTSGHADFYEPQASPLSGAASASDLAFATGRGPDLLADIEGRGPLVRDDDVAVFACRDAVDRGTPGLSATAGGWVLDPR